LKADLRTIAAVRKLDDFAPSNPACSSQAIDTAVETLEDADEDAFHAHNASESARDAQTVAQWALHRLAMDLRVQVKAQYGMDSDEVQAVGMKKKSKYQTPVRTKKTTPET
jgi:hypothetical protein